MYGNMNFKLQFLWLLMKRNVKQHGMQLAAPKSLPSSLNTTSASFEIGKSKAFESLPLAVILQIVSYLSVIDIFSLKIAGGSYILTAINDIPRPSLKDYIERVELFRRQRLPDKTLLDVAAFMGYDALIIVLLKRKPSPSIDSLLSALVNAAARGNNSAIKLLMGSKAKILDSRFTFRHKSPISEATKNGHGSTIELLISMGVSLEKERWCSEKIALAEAAERGYYDIVRLLLTRQPVGFRNRDYDTIALHFASKAGYYDISEELLGNDLKLHQTVGKTKFHAMSGSGKSGELSVINSQDEEGKTALHYAVIGGHTKIASLLLRSGARVEIQSSRSHLAHSHSVYNQPIWNHCIGWTPLHFAAADGTVQMVSLLLESGANIEAVDSHGQTALHLASTKGTMEMISALLQHNANKDTADNSGAKAIHKAAASGHLDIVRFLFDQNCDTGGTTVRGESLLHLAVSNQHTEMAALLLDLGVDVDAEDVSRRTPLHLSVQNCDLPTIEVLLESNAYLQTRDIEGKTPLHYAAQIRYTSKFYDVLLRHGANPDTIDRWGNSPQYLLYHHGPSME